MENPWHLRAVGIVALVLGLLGATDYVLSQYRIDAWFELLDAKGVAAYLDGLPLWVQIAWGLGVWAGLLGALLMLSDRRSAAAVLALAALGAVATTLWLVWLAPATIDTVFGTLGTAVSISWAVLAVLIWLYARAMHANGVLG